MMMGRMIIDLVVARLEVIHLEMIDLLMMGRMTNGLVVLLPKTTGPLMVA